MQAIVAKKGIVATLYIANVGIDVTPYEPVNLESYTDDQINASNLKTLVDMGWVVEYGGQSLPENPNKNTGSAIPRLDISEHRSDETKFSQYKKGSRVETIVDIPDGLSDEIQEKLKAAKQHRESDNVPTKSNADISSEKQIQPVTPTELLREGVGAYQAPPKTKPTKGLPSTGAGGPVDVPLNDEFGE